MPLTPYPELIFLLALSCPSTIAGVLYYLRQLEGKLDWQWLGVLLVEGSLLLCAALLFPTALVWHWPALPRLWLLLPLLLLNVGAETILLCGFQPRKWRFWYSPTPRIFLTLMGVAAAGAIEEVLYRGVLLTLLHGSLGWSFWLAALGANFLFALMHCYQSLPTIGAKFISGTTYTVLFFLGQSLLPGMLLHALQNVVVILLGRWQYRSRQ